MNIRSTITKRPMIKMKDERKIRGKSLDPIMRIGKSGITENVINDLKEHLKKRGLIKVKILRAYIEEKGKKEAFENLATMTGAEIIDIVGFTAVLAKKNKNKKTQDDR